MREKSLSVKPRRPAWEPKKDSRPCQTLIEISLRKQASHPWLPNKTLIFM
jgi:hypothetical protein